MRRMEEYSLRKEDERAMQAYGMHSAIAKVLMVHREFMPGRITVAREVILSAGTMQSPQILGLSGIGDVWLTKRWWIILFRVDLHRLFLGLGDGDQIREFGLALVGFGVSACNDRVVSILQGLDRPIHCRNDFSCHNGGICHG